MMHGSTNIKYSLFNKKSADRKGRQKPEMEGYF